MIDDEMQALLGGYAAGTLTPEEQKKLFEKSLSNQALFDALADEDSMRAALDHPLVKKSLLRMLAHSQAAAASPALPLKETRSNPWLWVAVAASLFVGVATIAYWPSAKPAPQQVAVATKPQPPAEPPPQQSQPAPANKPLPRPVAPPRAPIPTPAAIADNRGALAETGAEAKADAKAEAKDEIKSEAAAPAPASASAANSFRERAAAPAAKLAATPAPQAELFNNSLNLRAAPSTQIYAFLVDGEAVKPLSTINETRRSIPLGAHSPQAEVWLLFTSAEDPVLARALTGVLPLPNRNWLKLKTNP
jgi:hypothetical protein